MKRRSYLIISEPEDGDLSWWTGANPSGDAAWSSEKAFAARYTNLAAATSALARVAAGLYALRPLRVICLVPTKRKR